MFSRLNLFRSFSVCLGFLLIFSFNNCSPYHGANDDSSNKGADFPPVGGAVKSTFTCTQPMASSASANYVLSKVQYTNTLEDLFGAAAVQAASSELGTLNPDSNNSITNKRDNTFDLGQAEAYFQVGNKIAGFVVNDATLGAKIFGNCMTVASPKSGCISGYLNGFAEKIYRRPLTEAEKAFANKMMADGGTIKEKLQAILSYNLQSPYFLWLIEKGKDGLGDSKRIPLTSYEIASRISYMLTDSLPDDELLAAAKADQLNSKERLLPHAKRLLNSERGKAKAVKSIVRWSLTGKSADFSELPAAFAGDVKIDGLDLAMRNETENFVKHILFVKNGTFKELLNSKLSFAKHQGLAKIYNHAPVTNQPVEFTDERRGLLMRAPFFTGSGPRTNVIQRGVDFYQRLLCGNIPEPGVDIAAGRDEEVLTPAQQLQSTSREITAFQTKRDVCMSCHSIINATGNSFEMFDPLGRIRSQEQIFDGAGKYVRSLPVNTSGTLAVPSGKNIQLKDAADLIDYVATSGEGNECFIRGTYRFLTEKAETTADSCRLEFAFQSLANEDRPIVDAFLEIAVHPTNLFKYLE